MKKLGVLVLAGPSNGGTFQYTLSMLEGLHFVREWSITLYTDIGNSHYEKKGFPVRYINASPKHWPTILLSDWLRIKRSDPFHEENMVLAPIYSPLLLQTRKPFVFTLHDLQEHYFPQNFSLLQRLWRNVINKMLTSRSSGLICESDFVKRDIVRLFYVNAEKITVIAAPPIKPFQTDFDINQIEKVRAKYNLPKQFVFYPAQFWPHKNHYRLIDAFAVIADKFPEIELVLTGQKRYEFENVFARVAVHGLNSRVKHIGYVDQQDLGAIYKCALILAMPSLFESVSIPIYEAFQYQIAVCASNVVALPEQVGNSGLLFDPTSVAEIADSMEKLISSGDLRKQLVENGKVQLSKMTHQQYGSDIESVLNSVT